MPSDGVVQIAFDRYLLPSTTIRQSIGILDANNQPLPQELAPLVEYDPVARTLTLSNPRPGQPWLTEGLTYKLALPIPDGNSDIGGLRAIDRATLDPNQERLIAFVVGPPASVPEPPRMSFCRDVMPIFAAKCNSPGCHKPDLGTSFAVAAGLQLDSSQAIRATMINRVAQGANTSGRSTPPEETGRVFGINMAIVKPGDPGNSWLMYKLELGRPPVVDTGIVEPVVCNGPPVGPAPPPYAPFAPARLSPDEIERDVLSSYVLGREMPYARRTPPVAAEQPLTFEERERIRLWIAQGAEVLDCEGCGVPLDFDAGP